MVQIDVSFILSFVILMGKIWIFGFSPRVCPTELSNLMFSFECLVSNGRQALLWGIRLGGSATLSHTSTRAQVKEFTHTCIYMGKSTRRVTRMQIHTQYKQKNMNILIIY